MAGEANGAAEATQATTSGTVTAAAAATKPAKVTGKCTMVIEYVGDVEESKAHAVSVVKALRDAGLTVKAEFAETVPSKKQL